MPSYPLLHIIGYEKDCNLLCCQLFVCLFLDKIGLTYYTSVPVLFNPLHKHWLYSTEGFLQPVWSQLMSVDTGIRISIPSDVRTAANRPPFLRAHRISITPCLCSFDHDGRLCCQLLCIKNLRISDLTYLHKFKATCLPSGSMLLF